MWRYLRRLVAALFNDGLWEDHEMAWDEGWKAAQHAYKQAHPEIHSKRSS